MASVCRLALLLASGVGVTTGCATVPPGRTAVGDVTIRGAEEIDEDDVLERIGTVESPRFLGLFQGLVYDYELFNRHVLERDLERIVRFYRARGYYDAKVVASRVVPVDTDEVEVEIDVREGKPVLLRQARLTWVEGVSDDVRRDAEAALTEGITLGEPFDEERFAAAEQAILQVLTDAGFAHAEVERDAFVDVARHEAECTYRALPGKTARFGAVTIRGLGELPEDPVRVALDIEPGAPYSTAKLRAAEQAAMELGVLSSVRVSPRLEEGSPAARAVPIDVEVEPAKLRTVRLGGGLQLDGLRSDIHLRLGWEDRNFLGGMRRFSVDLRPGLVFYPLRIDNWVVPQRVLPELKISSELRQPGFLEERTTGFLRPKTTIFPVLLKRDPGPADPLLGYAELSGAVGVERMFWRLFGSLSQHVQVDVPFAYRGELHSDLETLLIGYPELVTALDLRDDRVHPHAGGWFGHTFQVAAFGSGQDLRFEPEARGYLPLGSRVTLAGRAALGFLLPISYGDSIAEQLNAPPIEPTSDQIRDLQLLYFRGFFSGGPSSNRGYAPRTISPHGFVPYLSPAGARQSGACDPSDPAYDVAACAVPVGGLTLWELSLELRFAIVGPLLAATFCDTADVAAGRAELRLDHPHLACGAGLRYDTPVGPLRLDVGYRIPGAQIPADADPRIEGEPGTIFGAPIALSFSIGEAF